MVIYDVYLSLQVGRKFWFHPNKEGSYITKLPAYGEVWTLISLHRIRSLITSCRSRSLFWQAFVAQMWEQSNFGDTILSAVMGRPIFLGAWSYQGDEDSVGHTNSTWFKVHSPLVQGRHRSWKGEMKSDLRVLSKLNETSIDFIHLHRVFTRGHWPPHLGGRAFPPSRGKYSTAWQKTLADSGTPMWPDPDDPICHGESEGVEPTERRQLRQNSVDNHVSSILKTGQRAISSPSACPGRTKVEKIGYIPNWITGAWPSMMSSVGNQTWDFDKWPPTQVSGRGGVWYGTLVGTLHVYLCTWFKLITGCSPLLDETLTCHFKSGIWSLPGGIGQREDNLQACLEDDLWVVQLDPRQSIQGWTDVLCIHTSGANSLIRDCIMSF